MVPSDLLVQSRCTKEQSYARANYRKPGDARRLTWGCKSRILVSLRVFRTKRHFQLSDYLLSYDALEDRDTNQKALLNSLFRLILTGAHYH